ncbi:MAG: efflux RND transporter periplasmic adaptor subunit [Pseudomonadota bacterium]
MYPRLSHSRPAFTLLLSSLLLASCDKPGDEPKETATAAAPAAPVLQQVRVVSTEMRSIQPGFEYPAVIEAMETASVRAQIPAEIVERNITPGALVNKGDLLIRLDDSQHKAKLAEAEAALLEARANANQAEADWERAQQLKPDGYISGRDFDLTKAKAETANAAIARLEASAQRAKLDLEHTKIHAPFSGKISAANYSVGDYVMPNNPTQPLPLFELVKLNPIYAVSNIDLKKYDEFVLKRMELEKQGKEIPPLELVIELPNGAEYPHKGEFVNWDHTAAAKKGAIAGRAQFDNPDGLLLPGHNMTLKGRVIDKLDRIMVPQKSVSQDQQGHYVMVVDSDGIVSRKNVTVGIREGQDWAVPEGLEAGEQVIVEGLQKVRPGDKVAVAQAK